jgi:hypothetical protein
MIATEGLTPWTSQKNESASNARRVCVVECRTCGFEPADRVGLPHGGCPKCHGHAWRRLVIPAPIMARSASRRPCGPKLRF